MMEPNVCFFSIKLDFGTIFTDFCERRFRHMIASTLEQKTVECFFTEIWFSFWVRHQYQKNIPAFFCGISAGITASRWKIAAVNFNSQQKLYDNCASTVLRRLTAVSAELPAISKITANLKKFLTRTNVTCSDILAFNSSGYTEKLKQLVNYTGSKLLNFPEIK